jgi:hypothetical protein
MAAIHFVDISYIKNNTNLDTSVNDKILVNILTSAEDSYLQLILGSSLYQTLQNGISTNTLTVKQKYLIDNKIIKYLLATIVYLSIDDLLVKYAASGVYANTPQNTIQLNTDQLTRIQNNKERDMNTYEYLIKSYIRDNQADFPEYESQDDIKAQKVKNFGFYIDPDNREQDIRYNQKEGSNDFDENI